MRKIVLILAMATTLILTGCGRKEAPQVVVDTAPPEVVELQSVVSGNSLRLDFRLTGGQGGVGYQIDRAEIDPHCDCPSFWRRYFEAYPNAEMRKAAQYKMINLKGGDMEYAFRIRAVDSLGRLSPWSKVIRAKAEPFFE